ncbi:MAG: ABC transporter permease [Planctomycetes bacterium]|nr:ABC transporter permease [Planctomycetota bacterium]
MIGYILRRIALSIPVFLAVAAITLVLFTRIGGDPVLIRLGKNPRPDQIERERERLGLDRPLFLALDSQYTRFLRGIASLDPGISWAENRPIGQLIRERIVPSASLAIPAFALAALASITIALASARFQGRAFDRWIVLVSVAGISLSSLVYVILLQYLVAHRWKLAPIWGYEWGIRSVAFLALPIVIWITVTIGTDVRYFRTVFLEEVRRAYVRTARAKGLRERRIFLRHVLRNALVPIVARLIVQIPFLILGSLLLETFFGIPGLGGGLVDAIRAADLPVVMAYVALGAVLYIAGNLLSDVAVAVADPRVRLR